MQVLARKKRAHVFGRFDRPLDRSTFICVRSSAETDVRRQVAYTNLRICTLYPQHPKDAMTNTRAATVPPPAHTRPLVLGWCLWLLGAWSVALFIDSTTPAVRWMVFSVLTGLMMIWPAVRLSQMNFDEAAKHGGAQTLLDWLCLMLVLQAVIWPLRFSAQWSFTQTWWLDSAIMGWSALTALIIAWGRRSARPWTRSVAMGGCVGLLLGEPALMILVSGHWMLKISPIQTVWALSLPPKQFVLEPWITHVVAAAAAAMIGWLLFAFNTKSSARPDA